MKQQGIGLAETSEQAMDIITELQQATAEVATLSPNALEGLEGQRTKCVVQNSTTGRISVVDGHLYQCGKSETAVSYTETQVEREPGART